MSPLLQLPLAYLLWHVTAAFADLWRLYTNIIWFLWNFFSIGLLSSTLISPWRRLTEKKSKDTAGLLGTLIINTLTRIFGCIVRLGVIGIGLCAIVICTALFLILFIGWIALPVIAAALIVYGIRDLLFNI